MIGIIISDLIFEIGIFCVNFIALESSMLIFIIIIEIGMNYSYLSAFMISYISVQEISDIQFSLKD